jgi:hypothetical protein
VLIVFLTWYVAFVATEGPAEIELSEDRVTFRSRRGRVVYAVGNRRGSHIRLIEQPWVGTQTVTRLIPDSRYFVTLRLTRFALSGEAFLRLREHFEKWGLAHNFRQRRVPGRGVEDIYEYVGA